MLRKNHTIHLNIISWNFFKTKLIYFKLRLHKLRGEPWSACSFFAPEDDPSYQLYSWSWKARFRKIWNNRFIKLSILINGYLKKIQSSYINIKPSFLIDHSILILVFLQSELWWIFWKTTGKLVFVKFFKY